jgi:hypothetical protein
MDFFVFLAILFAVVLAALGAGWIYQRVARNVLKKGDLVRMHFKGCPAALTTALWGVRGNYTYDPANQNQYGFNGSIDAGNALHCDVFGSQGTYSTWISSSGNNWKTLSGTFTDVLKNGAQRYYNNYSCATDQDCRSHTYIPCGPGFRPAASTYTAWTFGDQQSAPDSQQCPGRTRCSLCIDSNLNPVPCNTYNQDSTVTGYCVRTDSKALPFQVLYSCSAVYPATVTSQKFCNAILNSVTGSTTAAWASKRCNPLNNYSNSTGNCNPLLNPSLPFYCNYTFSSASTTWSGNADCNYGQECMTNTSAAVSGVPVYNPADPVSSAYVCSRTILADTVISLPWIAEGVITSENNGGTYNVDWRRINLQYSGVGPSPLLCPLIAGTTLSTCSLTPQAANDHSWKYQDCRFVLTDDAAIPSRHWDVKRALLGTSISNPRGLMQFSTSTYTADANLIDFNLLSVSLYVDIGDVGDMNSKITNGSQTNSGVPSWVSKNTSPFARSSWNLQSVNLNSNQLEKIFFYSILPVASSSLTDVAHLAHVANYNAKVQRVLTAQNVGNYGALFGLTKRQLIGTNKTVKGNLFT